MLKGCREGTLMPYSQLSRYACCRLHVVRSFPTDNDPHATDNLLLTTDK